MKKKIVILLACLSFSSLVAGNISLKEYILMQNANPNKRELLTYIDEGIRYLYNKYSSYLSYAIVDRLLSNKLFLNGPHRFGRLDVENYKMFGHYNPKAIDEINTLLKELFKDKLFKKQIVNRYRTEIAQMVDIYLQAYTLWQENQVALAQEKIAYLEHLRSGIMRSYYISKFPDDKYKKFIFSITNNKLNYDGGFNADTAMAFWIRRSIDQSDKNFVLLFKTLQNVFRN